MPVLRNIGCLATCRMEGGQDQIHPIHNAALVWDGPVITWVGPEHALPPDFHAKDGWDAGGRLVIPGLIDCHTHLAFGGWRADEFAQRVRGNPSTSLNPPSPPFPKGGGERSSLTSHLERGGKVGFSGEGEGNLGTGIIRTVRQPRACSTDDLAERCKKFLDEMAKLGVTTVECKSGYGLTVESELTQLNVYKTLDERHPMRIVSTFLGAHLVPPEYESDRLGYIDLLQNKLIPLIAQQQLAQFCDVFVEESAFTIEEARILLETSKKYGLRPKVHADQLTDGGGARLAAEVGAISADHLEYASGEGMQKMAKTDVVAVSLPLASLYMNQKPFDGRRFIEAGIPVAVATDFNPGTAPSFHLPLAMMLACTMQRMIPAEVLKGSTVFAAKALGLEETIGSLEPGKAADFAVIDAPDINHWLYHFRPNACVGTVMQGTPVTGEIKLEC